MSRLQTEVLSGCAREEFQALRDEPRLSELLHIEGPHYVLKACMTIHKTQLDIIRTQIDDEGYVSRNWCLLRFITRLGARICDLRAEGYEFTTSFEGGDYVYKIGRA